MWWRNDPEVLVVGAGPVGLAAACRLARHGVRVRVVDKQRGPGGRSYALALHPDTLKTLSGLGLEPELRRRSHELAGISFLVNDETVADLDWSCGDRLPLLILPQATLEELLAEDLAQRGVEIEWNRRVSRVSSSREEAPVVTVERLVKDSMGYPISGTGWVVHSTRKIRPRFVIGADGVASVVRRDMRIDVETRGDIETFAVFETRGPAGTWNHAIVAFRHETTNVLWPMGGGRLRWSFQLRPADPSLLPRVKDRSRAPRQDPDPRASETSFRSLLDERAPWFFDGVEGISWSAVATFERYLATRFGGDSLWLVGDAAHGASPVGGHSMNVGIQEAIELADALVVAIRGEGTDLLSSWEAERREVWERLLGVQPGAEATNRASSWAQAHKDLIPQWLPASGPGLEALLEELGLTWASGAASPLTA